MGHITDLFLVKINFERHCQSTLGLGTDRFKEHNLIVIVLFVNALVDTALHSYYAPPLIGRGIKSDVCLSDVCLSHTLGKFKNRGLGRLKLAHVTLDLDTTFKVKRSG